LKDDKATAEAWRDGWFHTGDAARRGEDGALHFVDRLKNIIRRAVAVIAAPDPVRDEEVLACVVSSDKSRQNAISIQDWCLERLAYFKAPGIVAFIDSLPVTATNKVQKAKLADFAVNP